MQVRARNGDVHDLAGLRAVGADLGRLGPAETQRHELRTCCGWRQPATLTFCSCSALAASSSRRQDWTFGPALEQGPTLTLGHAAPDAELDPVVQRVGQALGADDAGHADLLGPVLLRSLDEQRVGVGRAASPPARPVRARSLRSPAYSPAARVCSDMMTLSKTSSPTTRVRCLIAPTRPFPRSLMTVRTRSSGAGRTRWGHLVDHQ